MERERGREGKEGGERKGGKEGRGEGRGRKGREGRGRRGNLGTHPNKYMTVDLSYLSGMFRYDTPGCCSCDSPFCPPPS